MNRSGRPLGDSASTKCVPGDQFNCFGGTQNNNFGSGHQFNGATFNAEIIFGQNLDSSKLPQVSTSDRQTASTERGSGAQINCLSGTQNNYTGQGNQFDNAIFTEDMTQNCDSPQSPQVDTSDCQTPSTEDGLASESTSGGDQNNNTGQGNQFNGATFSRTATFIQYHGKNNHGHQ